MSDSVLLRAALKYAEIGLYVFPLKPKDKIPLIQSNRPGEGGFHEATKNPAKIIEWWGRHPDANIGMACKTSRILGVDLDEDSERDLHGLDDWAGIVRKYHIDADTWTSITGRGGQHLLYLVPVNVDIAPPKKLLGLESIDIKWNGHIVLPPSIHENGKQYNWEACHRPDETKIKHLPDALSNLFFNAGESDIEKLYKERPENIYPGRRDNYFNSLSGYLWKSGIVANEVEFEAEIKKHNERMPEPLDAKKLEAVIKSGLKYAQNAKPKKTLPSDVANAERFADMFRDRALYVPVGNNKGSWYLYDGTKWQEDHHNKVLILAAQSLAGLPEQLHTHKKITWMLEEAKPRMAADKTLFDQNPLLLNVLNGTVDLETLKLKPHDSKDFISKQCPVEFDPDALCPHYEEFLDVITSGRKQLKTYIQDALGYSMTGIADSHVFFMLYGQSGANGKSTLLTVQRNLLGTYAYHTDIENLLEQKHYIIPSARMEWIGVRLLTTSEAPAGRRLNESFIKDLTGGDDITGRFFYSRELTYRPTLKLWIPGNERPISSANGGIMRRARSIPFDVKIEKPIEGYDRFLLMEAPGILNNCLVGTTRYLEEGLSEPPEVTASTEEFKSDMDMLAPFIEECCIKRADAEVPHRELYNLYVAWNRRNQNTKSMSGKRFGIQLREHGITSYNKAYWPDGHKGKQVRKSFYRGLEINPESARDYSDHNQQEFFEEPQDA